MRGAKSNALFLGRVNCNRSCPRVALVIEYQWLKPGASAASQSPSLVLRFEPWPDRVFRTSNTSSLCSLSCERIKLTEWPAIKCQEVNRTDDTRQLARQFLVSLGFAKVRSFLVKMHILAGSAILGFAACADQAYFGPVSEQYGVGGKAGDLQRHMHSYFTFIVVTSSVFVRRNDPRWRMEPSRSWPGSPSKTCR